MEKFKPMPMHMPMPSPMPLPAVSPASMGPAAKPMPLPSYTAPINIHASYEEVNIYEPKKHHGHCHAGYSSTGIILVLFILLVIILRGWGVGPAATGPCK